MALQRVKTTGTGGKGRFCTREEAKDGARRARREEDRVDSRSVVFEPAYAPRHVTNEQLNELFDFYHLARTALVGKPSSAHHRMMWAAEQFHRLHPEVGETAAYKDLSNARA